MIVALFFLGMALISAVCALRWFFFAMPKKAQKIAAPVSEEMREAQEEYRELTHRILSWIEWCELCEVHVLNEFYVGEYWFNVSRKVNRSISADIPGLKVHWTYNEYQISPVWV